jgi:hypothetical protein
MRRSKNWLEIKNGPFLGGPSIKGLRKLPGLWLRLGNKEVTMHYVVFLAIVNRDGLTIAVVGAPFALTRSGASSRPRALYIITQKCVILLVIYGAWGTLKMQ